MGTNMEGSLEEKKWARRAHLSTLFTYPFALLPFPFFISSALVIVLPFVLWISRPKTSYSAKQALEAIYLQSILSLGYFGFGSKWGEDRVLLVFSYVFLAFLHGILLAISVYRTSVGKQHAYPFSFFPYLFSSQGKGIAWNEIRKQFEDKVSFKEFQSEIEELHRILENSKSILTKTNDESLRQSGDHYLVNLQKIADQLLLKPSDYKNSKQFLSYVPQTIFNILEKYQSLQSTLATEEDKKRTESLKLLFSQVNKTMEEILDKWRNQQGFHLDVEIEAMKKNIDLGGY